MVYEDFRICPTHIEKTNTLIEFISDEKPGLLLNAGSGQGLHTNLLKSLSHNVISFDTDFDLVKDSKPAVVASMSHMPFKSKKFDYVVCIDVLEHVKEDKLGLDELKRVAKKNSKLILSVPMRDYPFIYDPINKIRIALGMKPADLGLYSWGHYRLYSEKEFLNEIERRFSITDIRKRSSFFIALFENYIPYLLTYKFKLRNKVKSGKFTQQFANLVCKLDRKLFLERLGYINLILKLSA